MKPGGSNRDMAPQKVFLVPGYQHLQVHQVVFSHNVGTNLLRLGERGPALCIKCHVNNALFVSCVGEGGKGNVLSMGINPLSTLSMIYKKRKEKKM